MYKEDVDELEKCFERELTGLSGMRSEDEMKEGVEIETFYQEGVPCYMSVLDVV